MGRSAILRTAVAAALVALMLPVAGAAQVSAAQTLPTSLTSALVDKLGLDPSQVDRWSAGVVDVGDDWWAFGWGGDADAPATISEADAPWTVPVAIGVNYVQWQDPGRLPDFGPFSVGNGMLTGSVNGGPQLNRTYAVMTAVMGGDIPIGDDMQFFQQWDFVLGIPGLDSWHALPQFPDDTWNGGAFVASLAYGPSPWSLNFYTFGGGTINTNPFGGFGIITGDTLILGVEADPDIFSGGVTGGPFNPDITGRIALDVKDAPSNPAMSRVVTAPAGPLDETTFFGYLGNGRTIVPGLPGLFDTSDVVPFIGPDGTLWFKLFPWEPWGSEPPDQFFSDYLQVSFRPGGATGDPFYVGFQSHAGVDEGFAGQGSETGMLPAGYVMNDGAILFGTGIPYEGGALEVLTQGGFLATEGGQFQGTQQTSTFAPERIVTSDDPLHFDDEFPVHDLVTGEPVEPPPTTTTTAPPVTETTDAQETTTTAPLETTTTLGSTTTERPRLSTTSRGGECWWCWGIIALLFAFLICALFLWLKSYEWWTCWIPWGVVIWVWVPFLLAGLWWWQPAWWWGPLVGWFVVIGGYT
ncbi:MAG TPA: hypothetical protein VJP05_08490, partial [Acidimicrobiia bacterium]|nr:hypothetical protein [Acidimicrobiia bacterium]